jgi:hypothetical protein
VDHSLLGHAAGDDVLEDAQLVEVLELGAEATAPEEPGGAVSVIPEPLLVLLVLVVKVVELLLVDGLATRSAWGRTSQTCPPSDAEAS